MTVCQGKFVNQERVDRIKGLLAPDPVFQGLSETFRALGDPTRAKLLFALTEEELCVCDLTALLGCSQSSTSHQLRILRNLRLVKYRKDGRRVYYSLADDHIRTLFMQALEHVQE